VSGSIIVAAFWANSILSINNHLDVLWPDKLFMRQIKTLLKQSVKEYLAK
jgi:hypothetical protein